MRAYDLAPLPIAALGLTVLATCCPAEPAKPTLVQPVTTTAPAPAPTPPPAPPAGPPVARTVDVVDRQFGLAVAEPYRLMEGSGNSEYTTWRAAQGAGAKGELAKLPRRDGRPGRWCGRRGRRRGRCGRGDGLHERRLRGFGGTAGREDGETESRERQRRETVRAHRARAYVSV